MIWKAWINDTVGYDVPFWTGHATDADYNGEPEHCYLETYFTNSTGQMVPDIVCDRF